jgi:CheY-like chemotaxis protein
MATALICSELTLENELGHTFLWRRDFTRRYAAELGPAQRSAQSERPVIVLVERDLPWAERLVTLLRRDPATRELPIVVLARGTVHPAEAALLDAGADAILRLPPGPDWDADFARLVGLPLRREDRLQLALRVDAQVADELLSATVVNICVHGMLIQSPVPLEIGREIQFAFRLPGQPVLISGSGRVVRQAAPTEFGVEFLVLDAEDRERIRGLLDAAEAPAPRAG